MKTKIVVRAGLCILFGTLLAGCQTSPATSSRNAAPLAADKKYFPDLRNFDVVTVTPFDTTKAKNTDPSVGVRFAEDISRRLKFDFGQTFKEVKMGNPTGSTNELIVTGEITSYAPGDRALRGVMIGLGAASFKGSLCLKSNETQLIQIPFDKLWAWGGLMGMSKGIEDMEAEAAASIANTVAREKGWVPQK
jgi:hypothetical protein